MIELALELDVRAQKQINDLMHHYNVESRAEIICKALAALKTIAHIEKTNGQLIARKGNDETQLVIR